jgi:zinc transport system substrate-binding protein
MIRLLLPCLILFAATARADAPRVVTDIAPIHSLVAQVMDGVGLPDLIVPPGADAHHLALRPSDARKIAQADVVVWVGPELTPWLTDPLDTLAPQAATLTLLAAPAWTPRDAVEGHTSDAEGHADHVIDPHAWLDPQVAMVWVRAIRDTLTTTDPDNATRYAANAERALTGLKSLHDRIAADLTDVPGGTWIAPHDAFGYFTDRFALPAAGAISDSDAEAPGPAHLADLQALVTAGQVTCVTSETGGATDYADLLTQGTNARQAAIDDTGMALTPGPALYADLLAGIAATLQTCIQP